MKYILPLLLLIISSCSDQETIQQQKKKIAELENRVDSLQQELKAVVEESKSTVVNISSSQQFSDLIAEPSKLSVIDLYADWCGPCRMIAPTFKKLSGDFAGQANFIKVNVDKFPAISRTYNARSIPLIVFLKDGKEVDRVVGVRDENEYSELIQKHL